MLKSPNRIAVLLVLLVPLLATPAFSKTLRHSHRSFSDPDYTSALNAANRFLSAWENRDQEVVLLLLTDAAKHQVSHEQLSAFIADDPDAQRAYEISHGSKLKAGRYSFPAGFFATDLAAPRVRTHSRYSQIIVTRAGEHDWAIDKLP